MNRFIRRACPIVLCLMVGLVSVAGAQTLYVEGSGGAAVPSGELADMADPAASLQVSASYQVHRRILVGAMGSVDLLSGKEVDEPGFPSRTPDVELWSAGVGVEALVTPPPWRWFASLTARGMATSFNTEVFDEIVFDPVSGTLVGDFAETYFTTGLGLKLGYEVGARLHVFASAEWRRMFADEDDTAVFGKLSPEVEAFESASWIPLTAGLRYELTI